MAGAWDVPARSRRAASNVSRTSPTCYCGRTCCGSERPALRFRRLAFSAIELLGVFSIVAILAGISLPVVFRQMDRAAWTKEYNDLNAISNAFVLQAISTKYVPNQTNWANTVSKWVLRPASQITSNPRRFNRVFLMDTNLTAAPLILPYTQTNNVGLASAPRNARLMIVSSLSGANPPVTNGVSDFSGIWNTPLNTKPSGAPWTSSPIKGEDLLIQRINLEPLFHRLVLVNRDSLSSPKYAIDSTNTTTVTAGGAGVNAYYLHGSAVSLCDPSGTPVTRFVLTEDFNFVFEAGSWRYQIYLANSSEVMAQDFAALAAQFLAAQWYPGSHQGGDQQGALVAMFNFMLIYGLWANQCPHFPWHSASSSTQVPEYELLDDIGGNGSSGRLNEFTGQNGLLK